MFPGKPHARRAQILDLAAPCLKYVPYVSLPPQRVRDRLCLGNMLNQTISETGRCSGQVILIRLHPAADQTVLPDSFSGQQLLLSVLLPVNRQYMQIT